MAQSLSRLSMSCVLGHTWRWTTYLALSIGAGLTGCSTVLTGAPQPLSDPDSEVNAVMKAADAETIVKCMQSPTEACRDQIVGARMYAADLRFAQFESNLFREGRETDFGGSVASLGLSAAATASTGGTAQAFSAVNTLLLGTRESYQKDLLAEKTSAAIHAAMQARRNAVALRLRTGLTQSLKAYPLPVALSDLVAYIRAGSLLGALTEITDQVAVTANGVERELKDTVIADFSARDGVANATEAVLCGGKEPCSEADLDKAKVEKLKTCLAKNGLPAMNTDKPLSSVDGTTSIPLATRKAVLDCLNKP